MAIIRDCGATWGLGGRVCDKPSSDPDRANSQWAALPVTPVALNGQDNTT